MSQFVAFDLETTGTDYHKDGSRILCMSTYDGSKSASYDFSVPNEVQKAKEVLANPNTVKVGHNVVFDCDWLQNAGIEVKGTILDTMVREALIYPKTGRKYSLDDCCKMRGIEGKNKEDTIDRWWEQTMHSRPTYIKGKAIEHMDMIPFGIMSKYCEQDCIATYNLFTKQSSMIREGELAAVNGLESALIRPILRMRKNGIRIDEQKRSAISEAYGNRYNTLVSNLQHDYLIQSINSASEVGEVLEALGYSSTKFTDSGNDSWDKEVLEDIDHQFARDILEAKNIYKLKGTFIDGGMLPQKDGRLYTQFYQTKRDENGAITGRFSSAHPNLQNIPTKDKDIRSCFIPDDGCTLIAYDYKQIELRIFAHWVVKYQIAGWQQLKAAIENGADYHQIVMDMLKWSPEMRKVCKTLNFGILYGMGKETCYLKNKKLFIVPEGMHPMTYVDKVYAEYHQRLPFVNQTCKTIQREAKIVGYMRSISGRKHINDVGKEYVMTNKITQGTAADILKKAMVDAEKAGIWGTLHLHLTVHDEIVASRPKTKEGEEAAKELKSIMVNAYKLSVPMGVDAEEGDDWGHCA